MASFLFVTLEGGGNVPAVLGVVRRLTGRGHAVRVLTEPCLRESVEGVGAEFVAFERHFVRTERTQDLFGDSEARTPIGAMLLSLDRVVMRPAQIVADAVRGAIAERRPDVVVADVLMPGALPAAEAAGIPRVVLSHMPEYLPGPGRPAAGPGFLPPSGPLDRLRDRLMEAVFYRLLGRYVGSFNEARASVGLPAVRSGRELIGELHRADLRLIQTSRAFDFPIEPPPANVRYVGPILDDPDWVGGDEGPLSGGDSRPLVVVSLSSTFQNQKPTLERIIAALGRLEVRGLVTLGPSMAEERFDLPPNVTAVPSASHSRIFLHAAVVVTHCGHGTLMRALAHGLPVLCLPMGRDQNDNAARVVARGAGLRLGPGANPSRIAAALRRLLGEPQFAEAAVHLGEVIRADAAADRSVEELERLAQARRESRPAVAALA